MKENAKDVYSSVCEWEEKEAAVRDPEIDRKLYHETINSFRSYIEEIAVLKRKGTPEAKAAIGEKCSEACLLFVMLRKLNRLEKLRLKQSREELHKVKSQVDSQHLQLQNLLYEVLHLQKEVTKCLQFKSQDEEIDLVPVAEFLREAPASVKKLVKGQNAHQLQKARLEWELQQRRQLSETCQKLRENKEVVASSIEKKQQDLENLTPMLRNILQATEPLVKCLGGKMEETRHQQQIAYLLPQPLFFLYVHTDAHQRASDPLISVSIVGDEDEARRMKEGGNDVNEDEDSDDEDPEQEIESSAKSKRHHRKRSTKVDRCEERRKKLLAKHPLNVNLTISLKDGSKISIDFYYILNLKVITVQCLVHLSKPISGVFASQLLATDSILCSLFPGDTGLESPNMANYYQLQNVNLGPFSDHITQLGSPYVWAQKIAGLDFISCNLQNKEIASCTEQAKIKVHQASIPLTINALRQRFKSRLALCKQVQSLESGSVPPIPALADHFPTKVNAQVNDLKQLSWDEYRSHLSTHWLIEQEQVGELDSVYQMNISCGPAKAIALIAIKSNYPESPPLFALEVKWRGQHNAQNSDAIRDMEREVNVHFKELMAGKDWIETLLAAQVTRLLYCFDVYLEASSATDEDKKLFPQEKVFIQASRGRTRSLPYKFVELGGGMFTQR